MQHGVPVHKACALGGTGDREADVGNSATPRTERAAESSTWLKTWASLTDRDGTSHPDFRHLLGIALNVTPGHGEVLVDPDVRGPTVGLALVLTPNDDKDLFVLSPSRIHEFFEIVRAALPVGPNNGDRSRILVRQLQAFRQQLSDVGRVGPKLHREHLPAVMPWRRGQNRPCTRRGSRVHQPVQLRHAVTLIVRYQTNQVLTQLSN